MPQQFNSLPNYPVPLTARGITESSWYRFWAGLFNGLAPAAEVPVTVGSSPFDYSPSVKGFAILTGGTVTLVEFSRDGTNFYDYGTTDGQFILNAKDTIRITHAGAPDMLFVPT